MRPARQPLRVLVYVRTHYVGIKTCIAYVRIVLAAHSIHVCFSIVTFSETSPLGCLVNYSFAVDKPTDSAHNISLLLIRDHLLAFALYAPKLSNFISRLHLLHYRANLLHSLDRLNLRSVLQTASLCLSHCLLLLMQQNLTRTQFGRSLLDLNRSLVE